MITTLICLFFIGYLGIALEHPLKIDKTAIALLLGMLLWILYALGAEYIVPAVDGEGLKEYIAQNARMAGESLHTQSLNYILDVKIVEALGDITQTLFFLIGAMTIVELVDIHGGFTVITDHIRTHSKKKLLWIICLTTFVFSAVLDNMTTTIVMVLLLRKLVEGPKERWLYAGMVVIAANTGGAWSPIGDVTTIMLWVKGNVTALALIERVLLPSIVAMIVPLLIIASQLKGELPPRKPDPAKAGEFISTRDRMLIFILGVGGLLFVPIFKSITHLPPFVGILLVLGVLWTTTEVFYRHLHRGHDDEGTQKRVSNLLSRVDMSTILFFLGILMAVACLSEVGVLAALGEGLNTVFDGNHYLVTGIIGVLSSIVDNVPLVAGCMGMYPVAATGDMAVDGIFWQLLAYCAGVGGSMLIVGSAAGVVVMGLEKITFGWYMKKITWIAFVGYLAGIISYYFIRTFVF